MPDALPVAWLSAAPRITERRQTGTGFLFFAWLTFALAVVAMIEPSPSDIAIVVLVVLGFFSSNLRWSRTPLPFVLLGSFVLANLASLCYAIDLTQGLIYLLTTLFLIVLWLFTLGLVTKFQERGLLVLMSGYTVGGVLSSILAVLSYFGIIPFGELLLFYDRVKGFFKDPNVFGPYLVIAAVYAVHRLQICRGSLVQKAVWLFAFLVSTLAVLLCFSRAGWANYAVTLFAFFALNSLANRGEGTNRRSITYFVMVTVLTGVTVVYVTTIPQVSEVIAYRTEMQSYDTDRFATHSTAVELGLDNPLGVGPGQSFLLLDYATHSLYLRLFSENGVIGLFSFAAFVLLTLVRSLLLSQRAVNSFQRSMFSLIAAATLGILLNSFVIDTLHWRHFWFLLAFGWMPLWPAKTLFSSTSWLGPHLRYNSSTTTGSLKRPSVYNDNQRHGMR